MGIFARGSKLWIRYRDASGKWQNKSTGYGLAEQALAQEVYDAVVDQVSAAKVAGVAGPITVRAYARQWVAKREGRTPHGKTNGPG